MLSLTSWLVRRLFIAVGTAISSYAALPGSYEEAVRLQKYQVIEGYGSCIPQSQVKERGSQDVSLDQGLLRKMILKKDKDGAVNYLEDLLINNIQKDTSMDDVYKLCIQTAMLLQEIYTENHLYWRDG